MSPDWTEARWATGGKRLTVSQTLTLWACGPLCSRSAEPGQSYRVVVADEGGRKAVVRDGAAFIGAYIDSRLFELYLRETAPAVRWPKPGVEEAWGWLE
ncbi:MAG: hypothetical protein AMXMBFR4_30160 [Candidatus Hydrogenedentota bacterium]